MSVTGLLLGHDRELTGYLVLVGVVLAVVAEIGIRRVPLGVSTVVWPTTQVEWLAVGAFVAVPAWSVPADMNLVVGLLRVIRRGTQLAYSTGALPSCCSHGLKRGPYS